MQNGQRIGRLDRATGKITEYKTSGNPYGLAIDKSGAVWFCRLGDESLGRLDPATGEITHLDTGSGSRPRRIATAPDGMLWVTLYGNGKLIKVDPQARRIVKEYAMPAGRGGGPYAVTVDGAGRVWANEIDTDTVALFEPKTEAFRVIALPIEEQRHPQGDRRRAGPLLVHGVAQRQTGSDRMKQLFLAALLALAPLAAYADDAVWAKLKAGGNVLLIRHAATEPGLGDPPNFLLGDCKTQRNLSDAGREEARRVGRTAEVARHQRERGCGPRSGAARWRRRELAFGDPAGAVGGARTRCTTTPSARPSARAPSPSSSRPCGRRRTSRW